MERRLPKGMIPVLKLELCTECLMCQITCAQYHGGTSRPADSRIRVLASAQVSHPAVVVNARCDCPDREELCPRVCGPEALRFVPRADLLATLDQGWRAAPIEE